MNFKSLKTKLVLITVMSAIALILTAAIGINSIRGALADLNEVGKNRLPSVLGLEMINEGQTAIKAANLSTAIYENDYRAQEHFADLVKEKKEVWVILLSK